MQVVANVMRARRTKKLVSSQLFPSRFFGSGWRGLRGIVAGTLVGVGRGGSRINCRSGVQKGGLGIVIDTLLQKFRSVSKCGRRFQVS